MIDTKTRLRVGRSIEKTEEEVAQDLMRQVKRYAPDAAPPALVTDGKGAYREAMLDTWGKVPEYGGRGAPPKLPQPGKDWYYAQVIKKRKEGKLESVRIKVIYGDPEKVKEKLDCHTAAARKNAFDLTADERTPGSQDSFLFKRASFA